MRKVFNLCVRCETPEQLVEALRFAADCAEEEPALVTNMEVDEQDEQLCDPDHIESILNRSE